MFSNIHVLENTLNSADENCGPLSVIKASGMSNLTNISFSSLMTARDVTVHRRATEM